jgi:hypothetical protein
MTVIGSIDSELLPSEKLANFFGIYHISVLFMISHWLEIYTYSSFTKTLIAVALQSKGVLYKKFASFSDGNSSESIDPITDKLQ